MNKTKTRLPDFLIIGAGKSGTTSLDKYLAQHPMVYMSKIKEPNFFAYLDLNPEEFKDIPETYEHCLNSIRTWEDYFALFHEAYSNQVIGETSNTYLTVENALVKIKEHLPNVKLVAILRNPVDRLYSRFLHLARDGRLNGINFEEVFNQNSIWWKRNDLIKEGFYFQNLNRFYNTFDRKQIKVILFDDLLKDKNKTINEVLSFLQLAPLETISSDIEYNPSGIVRNQWMNRLIGHDSMLLKGLKKILSDTNYEKLKNNQFLQRNVVNLRKKNLEKPMLDPEIKKRINNEIYRKDINMLSDLIKRDLSFWIDQYQ